MFFYKERVSPYSKEQLAALALEVSGKPKDVVSFRTRVSRLHEEFLTQWGTYVPDKRRSELVDLPESVLLVPESIFPIVDEMVEPEESRNPSFPKIAFSEAGARYYSILIAQNSGLPYQGDDDDLEGYNFYKRLLYEWGDVLHGLYFNKGLSTKKELRDLFKIISKAIDSNQLPRYWFDACDSETPMENILGMSYMKAKIVTIKQDQVTWDDEGKRIVTSISEDVQNVIIAHELVHLYEPR